MAKLFSIGLVLISALTNFSSFGMLKKNPPMDRPGKVRPAKRPPQYVIPEYINPLEVPRMILTYPKTSADDVNKAIRRARAEMLRSETRVYDISLKRMDGRFYKTIHLWLNDDGELESNHEVSMGSTSDYSVADLKDLSVETQTQNAMVSLGSDRKSHDEFVSVNGEVSRAIYLRRSRTGEIAVIKAEACEEQLKIARAEKQRLYMIRMTGHE